MMAEFHVTMEGMKTIAGWFGSILNWKEAKTAEERVRKLAALTSLMASVTETSV